jgi:hypothetical protein
LGVVTARFVAAARFLAAFFAFVTGDGLAFFAVLDGRFSVAFFAGLALDFPDDFADFAIMTSHNAPAPPTTPVPIPRFPRTETVNRGDRPAGRSPVTSRPVRSGSG